MPRTLDRQHPVHRTLLAVAGPWSGGAVIVVGAAPVSVARAAPVSVGRAAPVTHSLGRHAPATRIATASTYTLRSDDHGASFRVVVTATNGVGSANS